MESPKRSAKDPAVGVGLSMIVPGLGHLYAGSGGAFVVFLAAEIWFLSKGWLGLLFALHIFQAVAAGGAVKQWNLKHGFTTNVVVPPPPPARGSRARPATAAHAPTPAPTQSPPTSAPQSPPPVLDADAFLAELQEAWREHRTGGVGSRQFADRKWRAIRAVRVDGREEGEALVAASRELAAAGVLTSEEIGQLAARVGAS